MPVSHDDIAKVADLLSRMRKSDKASDWVMSESLVRVLAAAESQLNNLGPNQSLILALLREARDPLSIVELSQGSGLDDDQVRASCDRLESRGFVRSRQFDTNHRALKRYTATKRRRPEAP